MDLYIKWPANGGPGDGDGDGIEDSIDTGSETFADGEPGTFGSILDAGGGVFIADLVEPFGVKIVVSAGGGPATIRVCGFTTLTLPTGGEADVTCGSVTIDAIAGPVVVEPDGDGVAIVSIPTGVRGSVSDGPDDTFTVEHLAGDEPITVAIDGE